MSAWHAVGRQLRRPDGAAGSAVGHLMRLVNGRANALAVASLSPRATDRVLELGCGPGHGIDLLARRVPHGTVYGIDWSAAMLTQAYRRNRRAVAAGNVGLYRADFTALPFATASVDRVLAVNVAYFWRDVPAVLYEVRRVLRPGGVLLLYVTDAASMQGWKFAGAETHRLFDAAAMAAALQAGGFGDGDVVITPVPLLLGVSGLIATARNRPY